MKLDAKKDLRVGFGDYLEASVPNTDNTMAARTAGCIALLPTGNLTGSVYVWMLGSKAVVKRDQFRILPTPDTVITHLNKLAALLIQLWTAKFSKPKMSRTMMMMMT